MHWKLSYSYLLRRGVGPVVGNFNHCLEVNDSTHEGGREFFFVCMVKGDVDLP